VAQLRKQHEAELTTQRLQLTESLRKVETLETELRKYDTIAEEVSQLESSIRQVQKESSGHQLRLQEQYQQVEFLYSLD
jgi:predicted  nucleic acid-binding Zn-ribbon protein